MAWFLVPAHVNEDTDPVDNLGGILSVVLVGSLVLSINFIPVPGKATLALSLGILALAACVAFLFRQKRAANPCTTSTSPSDASSGARPPPGSSSSDP